MKTTIIDGIPEVHPTELQNNLSKVALIDVRRPEEFTGELGHIDGSVLVTLGPDLQKYLESAEKNAPTVFICRSGARSGQATQYARSIGFKESFNMSGGMILWNELKLPVER